MAPREHALKTIQLLEDRKKARKIEADEQAKSFTIERSMYLNKKRKSTMNKGCVKMDFSKKLIDKLLDISAYEGIRLVAEKQKISLLKAKEIYKAWRTEYTTEIKYTLPKLKHGGGKYGDCKNPRRTGKKLGRPRKDNKETL